jgi:hypothetical protein
VGDPSNIVFRSSWERKAFLFLDSHPDVIAWGSEEIFVPYISPIDKKVHRYFPDLIVKYRDRNGNVKKAMWEIKPAKQTKPPVEPKRKSKRFLEECKTYAVNCEKWKEATRWCAMNGFDFHIVTEKELQV